MCGRYNIIPDAGAFMVAGKILGDLIRDARYNVAPSQVVPIVVLDDGEPRVVQMRWGFVPHWQKDPKPKIRPINARDDHLTTSAMFRESWRHRRCLVPATGFYEWKTIGGAKHPFLLRRADHQQLFLGGIWDRWPAADGPTDSFAIITTLPNTVAATVHDRMPVILSPDDTQAWGDSETAAKAMLQPWLGDLEAFEVSTRVNSPQNDDPSLIRPASKH